jgi:phosphodiesterase/alkaline phosphatase D-like protein
MVPPPVHAVLALAALVAAPGAGAQGVPMRPLPNLVAAGDVGTDAAVLWARAGTAGVLVFQVATRPDFAGPLREFVVEIADASAPARVELAGLQPDTRYHYRALQGPAGAAGTFRTAARPGGRRGLRFGVSGDHRGDLAPFPSVRNAPGRQLDFFAVLGDAIYADVPSPNLPILQATTLAEFRIKHDEVYGPRFGLNALGELRAATALLATIDDHEVTNDFAGGAHPGTDPRFRYTTENFVNETQLFTNALAAFHDFHPLRLERYGATGDARTAGKPRLYRARRFGDDAAVFVLDARTFRDPPILPVTNPFDSAQITRFLQDSFAPGRTLLGAAQLADFERDLLAAHAAGVAWKFVLVPEPFQHLGLLGAADRYEGYAAERSRLLGLIERHDVRNVVFVAADVHGTVVNDLTWQTAPYAPRRRSTAFEVTTGAVAYDAPLGPTFLGRMQQLGVITPAQYAQYASWPRVQKDLAFTAVFDAVYAHLAFEPLGLDGSLVHARLTHGSWTAAHVYGWTEFEIDPDTAALTVTTWGIEPYRGADLLEPRNVLNRQPEVVSRFVVDPQ